MRGGQERIGLGAHHRWSVPRPARRRGARRLPDWSCALKETGIRQCLGRRLFTEIRAQFTTRYNFISSEYTNRSINQVFL